MPAAKKGRGRTKKVEEVAPSGHGDDSPPTPMDEENQAESDKSEDETTEVKEDAPVVAPVKMKRGRGKPKKVDGEKKKRKAKPDRNFSMYIYRVLKQVHPGMNS